MSHLLETTRAPRWVEARACLLAGAAPHEGTVDDGEGTLFVVGRTSPAVLAARVAVAESIIVAKEELAAVAALAPRLTAKKIVVHTLPSIESLPTIDAPVVVVANLAALVLPDDLREELAVAAAEGREIVAALSGGEPASFCYAGAITESWWDVSIDTLEAHRRRGLAAACAARRIRDLHAHGKAPVWQALEENPASWRLAQKLGFVAVDELWVLERDESGS